MNEIPKRTYEMTEGTAAAPHAEHEPRRVEHTITRGDEVDLMMMTEIGDGVFVQWSDCRRCNGRVADCKCPEGPQEPHYMTPWRDARFKRELKARSEPDREALQSVITYLKAYGYTVTKGKAAPSVDADAVWEEAWEFHAPMHAMPVDFVSYADARTADEPATEQSEESGVEQSEEPKIANQVDSGLDKALEQVKTMKQAALDNNIELDF